MPPAMRLRTHRAPQPPDGRPQQDATAVRTHATSPRTPLTEASTWNSNADSSWEQLDVWGSGQCDAGPDACMLNPVVCCSISKGGLQQEQLQPAAPCQRHQQQHQQQGPLQHPPRVDRHTIKEEASGLRGQVSNMALLIMLYMMQGIPLGLTIGAMPFMLQTKLSYAQMGIFSIAAYPYSLKLLWSPVVDSCYSSWLGRRKSWIIPMQLMTAAMLISCAGWVEDRFQAADVGSLTALFFVFVFVAATQDIAVDGWALTLLPPRYISWASTCQTIGTSTGFFTSFTIFLALHDGQFCDTYIRSVPLLQRWFGVQPGFGVPLVSLPGYLRFWGWVFLSTTVAIAVLKPEGDAATQQDDKDASGDEAFNDAAADGICSRPLQKGTAAKPRSKPCSHASSDSFTSITADCSHTLDTAELEDAAATAAAVPAPAAAGGGSSRLRDVAAAYRALWRVVQLPAVWRLTALLLTYRLGMLAAEGGYTMKLLDKGMPKESLAFLILFQFPVELLSALIAGRWASNSSPYGPFILGYFLRLVTSSWAVWLVNVFPANATSLSQHPLPFMALMAMNLMSSFANTLTFTALGSFFNGISDPAMGGAYLTLLNTISNMGGMLPKAPIFFLMGQVTRTQCLASDGTVLPISSCPKKAAAAAADAGGAAGACVAAGGQCSIVLDGFYPIASISIIVGALLGLFYMHMLPSLMSLPLASWRSTAAAAAPASSTRSIAAAGIGSASTSSTSISTAASGSGGGNGSSRSSSRGGHTAKDAKQQTKYGGNHAKAGEMLGSTYQQASTKSTKSKAKGKSKRS